MSVHYKTFWRNEIVSRIAGSTIAGFSVYTNKVSSNSIDTLWINVSTSTETITNEPYESSLTGVILREQRYNIDICVKDNNTAEDTAEEIAGQIEVLLLTDEFLSASCYGLDYEGSESRFSDDIEKKTLIYTMTFNVRGLTPRNNPFI